MLRSLVMALVLAAATAQAAGMGRAPTGPLPDDVRPTHYGIELTVIPEQMTFAGKVVIDVEFKAPTTGLWLHGRDLSVSSVEVIDGDGTHIPATWAEVPKTDGVAKLTLSKPARGPAARIVITYTAPFNKQLEGLYRSVDGGESYVFSQMEPISARLAFPGFDEPRFKTPFDIALTVRDSHAAISNAPALKTEPLPDGMKRVQFATTKPLPTYLIAVAVGPFDVVEWEPVAKTTLRDRVVPLRGIATKGKGVRLKYALAKTSGLLRTLEDYFGIPYPFEKLDIIAATDFSAGAMENAGAIVYRESLLLLDDTASLSQKRHYVDVHTHEMAHQWVGDLVTPVWWNDIWLNEAFATWMANKAATTWDPKGEYDRQSLRGALGAMSADSKTNARRIAQPINSNDDIDNAFDSITYEKGGGVLSMFEQYYGIEAFRKGVKLHLQRHAFGNATARDFLQSVADANNDTKGVAAFETFLNQPGVPLITAELSCAAEKPRVSVKQSRYSPQTGQLHTATEAPIWKVPLCISYGSPQAMSGHSETCSLLEERVGKVELEGDRCPSWIMPNAQGAGYYRFSLDKKGWNALTDAADSLTDKELLAALDSLEASFNAGEMDVSDYLDYVKTLAARNGGDMTWDAAGALTSELTWIKDGLVSEKAQPAVQKFIDDLYGPLYAKIGLDPTSAFDRRNPLRTTLLRGPVVSMVVVHDRAQPARTELAKRGAAYIGLGADGKTANGKIHPDAVDTNLVDQALIVAVQDLGKPVVEAVTNLLKTERDGNVRSRMLGALMRSTDPAMAAKVREMAFSSDLRVNEVPVIVYAGLGERANAAAAWAWFKNNFEAIKKRMPTFNQGELAGVGGRFCSPAEHDDYKKFFEPKIKQLTGAPRVFAATLENIDHCIALVQKQRPKAEAYFAAQ